MSSLIKTVTLCLVMVTIAALTACKSGKPTAVCGLPFDAITDLQNIPHMVKTSWKTLQYSYQDSVFVSGLDSGITPLGLSINAEMSTNDSVLFQGEVFDSKTGKRMPHVFFFTVTNDGDTYIVNSEKTETDFVGKFFFKVSVDEAATIIAHSVGYYPALINVMVY